MRKLFTYPQSNTIIGGLCNEYADSSTQRGQCMLKTICEEMGFDSLGYQSLDGLLEAIGLDRDKVCTYCWTGEE